MPIDISARILGDKQLAQTLERLSGHDIPKAIKAGVRYAARGGRTAIAKNIGANYSLSAARIKKDVSDPTYQDGGQTAIIRTSRKPITFASYKARDIRPRGVSVAIYKGKRSRHPQAFGAKGLFWTRQGKARLPIKAMAGPSIHAIYDGGLFSGAIQSATEQRIEEQLITGIMRSLGGMARGFGRS
jgi:hypothetical protein